MKLISVLVLCLLLNGCTTAYQPDAWSGGYQDEALGNNTYEVWFGGNGYTKEEKVTDFTLLRSAELTLEEGFSYFIILEEKADSSYGYKYEYLRYGHANVIKCFNEPPLDVQMHVYDAKQIQRELKLKYNLD